ncbi:MAG: hypothetical protein SF051_00565, partial [Elusimicrobiota bacterium]|nr:hypothetical protein [Elusimicrobiota bacterium]
AAAPTAAMPSFGAPPPAAAPDFGAPPAALDIGAPEPAAEHAMPPVPAPAPAADAPAFDIELPSIAPTPAPEAATAAPVPVPVPEPAAAPAAGPAPFDPLMSAEPFPRFDTGDASAVAAAPGAPVEDLLAPGSPAAKPKKGKALLVGALLGLLALGGGAAAFFLGLIPGMGPAAAPPVAEAPLPAPEPVAPPAPAVDPRQEAVAFAKQWSLPGGVSLGSKLDAVAPASGSLSPWMAETLPDGRVQVNYFASGAASGSPTIAYEFVVDLTGKALSGRNAAAKSILTGKAPKPPKPLAPKPVRVKPKKAPAPKPVDGEPADDESLDSLLGGDEPAPKPAAAKKPSPKPAASEDAEAEALLLPGFNEGSAAAAPDEDAPQEDAAPKPAPARKSARPARGGKKPAEDAASDEALLDDLLEE